MTENQTTKESAAQPLKWRDRNAVTDWEFAEIGKLLCDHEPHEIALLFLRLQGQMEMVNILRENDTAIMPRKVEYNAE